MLLVLSLIVKSAVTVYRVLDFAAIVLNTKVEVGNFSVPKNLLISSDRLISLVFTRKICSLMKFISM
jgi:hypothetical protein